MIIPSIIHHSINALKRLAMATGLSALVALSAGSMEAASTTIELGVQDSGTAISGQGKVLKIAQGTLPAGSLLRSVAINARVDVGDPYCGDICVFVADSSGANGVLLVGDYDTDSAPALAADTKVRWDAGNAYGVGTTVNKTITTGIPAIDLNSSAVFLTSAYGGTWSGSITLTYDGPAAAGIPVTSGLVAWVKADAVNTGDTNQVRVVGADTFVKQWNDSSGAGRNATNTNENDQPKYIANALNGKPAIRFTEDDSNNGDRLYLGDLSAQTPSAGSVFVVATPNEVSTNTGYTLFDNRGNDGRWISGPSQYNESTPGTFRDGRDGSFNTNSIKVAWPTSGAHVFAMESSSSTYRYLIDGTALPAGSANYHSGSGQNWTIGNRAQGGDGGSQFNGDIAELVIFNRVLSTEEANAVGGYLAGKYGVATTTYPIAAPAAPADLTATGVAGAVNLSWTAATNATSYNVQRSTSSGSGYALIGTVTGTTYTDATEAAGTTYYYVVTAQNSGGTSPVSNEANAARLTSSAKSILTFGANVPGTYAHINAATATIAWIVPQGMAVTALSPTYTVSSLASGNPDSGTERNFTEAQSYTVTAEDHSTQVYTVTATVEQVPVTGGLIVWLKAGTVDTGDANQVRTSGSDVFIRQWNDSSGAGRNAANTNENDQPKYIANALNGKPAIRFTEDDSNNGDRLYLGDLSAQTPSAGSVFVVATPNETSTRTGYTLFDNRGNDGRWISGPSQYNESTPGTFRDGRDGSFNTIAIKAAWPTSGSHVFAMESSSSTYRYLIDGAALPAGTANYHSGSGQNWTIGNRAQSGNGGSQFNGDIAELVIFNRVLSSTEAAAVGRYLQIAGVSMSWVSTTGIFGR